MSKDWRPSRLGKLFTRSADWSICMDGERVDVVIGAQPYQAFLKSERQLQVSSGLIWSRVEIKVKNGLQVVGDGLLNASAAVFEGKQDNVAEIDDSVPV
ncbi:hypothetical protein, partial [Stenotrophomonas maltophilia]